jgi:hypothetical protein
VTVHELPVKVPVIGQASADQYPVPVQRCDLDEAEGEEMIEENNGRELKKARQAFREAIEQINGAIDGAVETARAAGIPERYIADALRKRLRHRAKDLPKSAISLDEFMQKHSSRASIDPEAWRVVDGKLYLNYSKGVQKKWEQDVPGNIIKADKNWPDLHK